MRIGGWKTDSVFRRYNIVDERDLEEAAQALNRKKEASQTKEVDTCVTIPHRKKTSRNPTLARYCAAMSCWCREQESNLQGTKYRRILSPLRLPVPPSRRAGSC